MKICIVSRNINSDYTGSFEFDQALALKRYGHDVYVLSLDMRSIRRKRRLGIHTDTYEGITVMRCSVPVGAVNPKLFEAIGVKAFATAYRKLEKLAGGFDVVNPHFLEVAYLATYAIKSVMKKNVPVAATEHFSLVNVDRSEISEANIRRGEYLYHNADRVIAVSSALAEKIKSNFGVEAEVVYNVFDGQIFHGEKRNHDDDENFTFVSAGNLTKNKRMDLLIRGFERAFPDDDHAHLYIFGDGPEREKLEKLIDGLNLGERVFLLGRKPRAVLADFYESADAFTLLSKRETFGVAYIEAMASGMPVIACRSGGPEDFLIPEVGMFISDDEESVADALRKLRAERNTYSDDFIRDYAEKICGGQVIAGQLTGIFQSMIK